MSVYKDEKTGKWRSVIRYTDWSGESKQTQKRGFDTKREAQAWEREQLNKASSNLNMTFESFIARYREDMKPRIRENTWQTKDHIITTKLLPYFGKMKMSGITPQKIIAWQNEMMNYRDENGKPYSQVYLRTIHTQLTAIFNHAVTFYDLSSNPCRKAGSMGKKRDGEMLYWTKEEYLKFSEAMMEKPISFYAFELLYWCGIREGELLALTPADFDFKEKTLRINKSYQRIKGKDVVTPPKTDKSNRIVPMPDFLCDEIHDLISKSYGIQPDERLFQITKSYLHREMERGSKEAGVKKIRVHDIRHSHVSLLLNLGYDATAVGDRVGHESTEITDNYAHMFQSRRKELAEKLDSERGLSHVTEESR